MLMETYEAQGERSLALQAYQRCRKVLRDELGVEPDIATRRLAASLGLAETVARARAGSARSRTSLRRRNCRPKPAGSFPPWCCLPPSLVVDDPSSRGLRPRWSRT